MRCQSERDPMLKMITCVKRRPGMTATEFDTHWIGSHAPLIRKHAEILGIRRYVQNTRFPHPTAQGALEAGRGAPAFDFDGCAELWWDDLESHLAVRESEAGRAALQEIIEDEAQFIDLSGSLLWYCEERPII